MNTTVTFSALTMPTPEPYDSADPNRQRENFYYVLNQILTTLKANSATLDLDITQAVGDLSFAGEILDMPGLNIRRSGKTLTIDYTP